MLTDGLHWYQDLAVDFIHAQPGLIWTARNVPDSVELNWAVICHRNQLCKLNSGPAQVI